ncbi:MAG UNVERIFIED_CONTAM: hypothetical protein LVQ98_08630 [Rickettsiaceae bacterium]|jgi:hypothetical protein
MQNKVRSKSNKIANLEIAGKIKDYSNIALDTIKMIDKLCNKNKIYIDILSNLSDLIERGIEAITIERIANNIFHDIIDEQNRKLQFAA